MRSVVVFVGNNEDTHAAYRTHQQSWEISFVTPKDCCNRIRHFRTYRQRVPRCEVESPPVGSVSWMNSVVEIDAGKDGKHVSLQERDQKFERGQRNRQRER